MLIIIHICVYGVRGGLGRCDPPNVVLGLKGWNLGKVRYAWIDAMASLRVILFL